MNLERGRRTPIEVLKQETPNLLNPKLHNKYWSSAGRVGDEIWRDVLKLKRRITRGRCPQEVHLKECRCGLEVRARNVVIGEQSKTEQLKPAA